MAEKQQPIVRPRTMSLLATLSSCWQRFQADFVPGLREVVGPLSERQERFVMVLDLARVEALTPHWHGLPGRPPAERAAFVRGFFSLAGFVFCHSTLTLESPRSC